MATVGEEPEDFDYTDYLQLWLDEAYQTTFLQPTKETDDKKFLLLGQQIFSLPKESSLKDVCDDIYSYYKHRIRDDETNKLIQAYLVHSLSEHCPRRQEYIDLLKKFDSNAVLILVDIHENFKAASLTMRNSDENGENEQVAIVQSFAERVSEGGFCRLCPVKDEELRRLRKEIIELTESEKELKEQKESTYADFLKEREAKETEQDVNSQKDETIGTLTVKVEDLEQRLKDDGFRIFCLEDEADKTNAKLEDIEKQFKDLEKEYNEEIRKKLELEEKFEIAEPLAKLCEENTVKLQDALKELDELKNVKEFWELEKKNHNRTYGKLVEYEMEKSEFEKEKKFMEKVQEDNSQLVSDTINLKALLKQAESDLARMRDENIMMKNEKRSLSAQVVQLDEELQAKTEKLREIERAPPIGDSYTEMNPVFMQELYRLRLEVLYLKDALGKSTMELLEGLRKELAEEQLRYNTTLTKWTETQIELEKTMLEVSSRNSTIDIKNKEIEELQTVLEMKRLKEKDPNRSLQEDIESFNGDQLRGTIISMDSEIKGLRQKIDELVDANVSKDQELLKTREDLEAAVRAKLSVEDEYRNHLAALAADSSLGVINQAIRDSIKNKFEGYINDLSLENNALHSEKLQAQKHVVEMKQQLDVRVHELKLAKNYLQEAHQEINSLKARLLTLGDARTESAFDQAESRKLALDLINELDKELGTSVARGLPTSQSPFLLTNEEVANLVEIEARSSLVKLNISLMELHNERTILQSSVQEKTDLLKLNSVEITTLKEGKKKLEEENKVLLDKIGDFDIQKISSDIKDQIRAEFSDYINDKNMEISLLKQQIDNHNSSVSNLKHQLKDAEAALALLKSRPSTDDSSGDTLLLKTPTRKIAKSLINEIDKEIGSSVDKGIPSSSSPFMMADEDISNIDYDELKVVVKKINKALVEVATSSTALTKKLKEKELRVEQLEANIILIQSKTANIEATNKAGSDLDSITNEIKEQIKASFSEYINSLTEENKVLKYQIDDKEKSVSLLKQQVVRLENDISSLKSRVSAGTPDLGESRKRLTKNLINDLDRELGTSVGNDLPTLEKPFLVDDSRLSSMDDD
eukprot:gene15800-21397_t